MKHSFSYMMGMLVGIVLSVALIFGLIYLLNKRLGFRREYDERQRLAQGKAYKAAFFTLLCYLAGYGIFDLLTGIRWCDSYTGAFVGVILSVTVFAIICIREDAYVSYKENPKISLVILSVIGAINLVPGLVGLGKPNYFLTDGMLNSHVINLLIGAMMIGLCLAMRVRVCRNRREE